jgi:hypothetical protein
MQLTSVEWIVQSIQNIMVENTKKELANLKKVVTVELCVEDQKPDDKHE